MSGKETILILLDVGSSMYKNCNNNEKKTRLQFAINSIILLLQQKILYQPTHEIGLILFGADEAEDGNTLFIQEFCKVNFDFIRNVGELTEHDIPQNQGGDIFDALEKSVVELGKYLGKKKSQKKIFVITNGQGESSYSQQQLDNLIRNINGEDIKLNIIAIDFCDSIIEQDDDQDDVKMENEETLMSQNQIKNQNLLSQIAQNCEARIFSAQQTMEIYSRFRSKSIYPRVKLRTQLEITENLKFDVLIYSKVSQQSLPSMKKFSKASNYEKSEDLNEVQAEKIFFEHDDPNMDIVENKIKGYYYGKYLVPVQNIVADTLKFCAQKCLKLLGFVDMKGVPRNFYLGGVDMIFPPHKDKNNKGSQQAFDSFHKAMTDQQKGAFVRYVYRENGQVRLSLMIPHTGKKYKCFWLINLPTVEDIRDYQFQSLRESTQEQQEAAKNLILSMDLMQVPDENGIEEEILKLKNTFNPILQKFYQAIIQKAKDQDYQISGDLLDPAIDEYVHPERKMWNLAEQQIKEFKEMFKLKEHPKKREKRKIYWRDVLLQKKEEQKSQENQTQEIEEEEDIFERPVLNKKFNFDENEDITRKINSLNPLQDFKKMMEEKREDLTEIAFFQMKKLILEFIRNSIEGSHFDIAINCLKELRKSAIEQDEVTDFNDYIYEIRDMHLDGQIDIGFWNILKENSILPISCQEYKESGITREDAEEFFREKQESIKEEENQDELADELD